MRLSIFHSTSRALREFFLVLVQGYERAPRVSQLPNMYIRRRKLEIDYAVYSLSDEFYEKYPNPPYKELLKKKERRYACLLIQSHYGYFICIPYRTEISHKYAYHFRKSSRSQKHR